jgi:hypothetical protein
MRRGRRRGRAGRRGSKWFQRPSHMRHARKYTEETRRFKGPCSPNTGTQHGRSRDPRSLFEKDGDDTADFNIGTHTLTNTRKHDMHSEHSKRAFIFPRFVSERADGIQLPGRAIHHSIKSKYFDFDDTRQAQSDKDPEATKTQEASLFVRAHG